MIHFSAQLIAWYRSIPGIGLGMGLILWHLVLIQRVTGNLDQLLLSLVFWGAIAYLIPPTTAGWQTRPVAPIARGLGLAIVSGLAIASLQASPSSAFVRLFPGAAALAWMLITLGWPTATLWRPGLLVLALVAPPRLLPDLLHPWESLICKVTAQVAAFGLYAVGFSVNQQGALIHLPQGTVEVEYACTGVALAGLLLQLTVLMSVLDPHNPVGRQVWSSGAIAFCLSSLRVAVMATVVDQPDAFQYWHGTAGNQIFTTLAFLLFSRLPYPQSRSFPQQQKSTMQPKP